MGKNPGRRTTRSSKRSKPSIEEEQTIEVKLENGEIEPNFCRICLRIPPVGLDLLPITSEQKTKLQDTIKLKLRKDPRQHICPNCSNLLDIIFDFKASVLKANQVLLDSGRPSSAEHDEWFQSTSVQVIAQCKSTVEIHRQLIETASEPPVADEKPEIPDEPEVCPTPPLDGAEIVEIKVEPFKEPDAVSNADAELPIEEDVDDEEDGDFTPKAASSRDEDYVDVPKKQTKKERKPRRRKENPKFQPQLCTLCGKRVCGEAAEAHRNQHLGIKPYRCSTPGCNLEFYGPYHKTRHERRMHGESGVLTHKCHICGKMIRGPNGALKYHLSLHGTSEKKFVCTICGKGFTLQRYLRQHGMSHSEEFPYACSYCGKRFNNKWSMRTHEKNMHEKRNQPSVPAADRTDKELLEPTTETTWTSTENMELMNLSGD